jgi:steroid 5-alpha reductase family enzyme
LKLDFALWVSVLPLLLSAATLTWGLSLPLRNVSCADPLWSLMLFAAGVVYALGSDPRAPRLSLVLWLLALWAARLSLHVSMRNSGNGEAHRYQALRERHQPFWIKSLVVVFWWRAFLAWVISLPLLGAFSSNQPIGWLDRAGVALWLAGFAFETLADWQLARFRRNPANAGKVMDQGLWRFSRHPNYFGEFCIWWGVCLMALGAGAWWAVAGPLVLSGLLLRASRQVRREIDGGNPRPQYADYVLKTNAFLPGPPRK